MANIRNSRTTHPMKQARRDGAADRFKFDGNLAKKDPVYAAAKASEAKALGIDLRERS